MTARGWAVQHRREDGFVLDTVEHEYEYDARASVAACHAAGEPCVLLRRQVGPWVPLDDTSEVA